MTLCLTFDPERSGELFYLPRRGWTVVDEDDPSATAHGSWHDYDQLVPLILLPPDRGAPHARRTAPESTLDGAPENKIEMTRVTSLVARWLGVTPPRALPPRPPSVAAEANAPGAPAVAPAGSGSSVAP